MVDNSDVLIACWNGTSGGTANCVKYAEKTGNKIYRINPDNHILGYDPDEIVRKARG